jgi:hypothetical protein
VLSLPTQKAEWLRARKAAKGNKLEKRSLNEREKLFIELLFSTTDGNAAKAKVLAGYSESYPTRDLVARLEEDIIEATKKYISQNAPKAAVKLVGILDNPVAIGNKELLATAKDVLDRAGLAKVEKVEMKTSGGIFYLPSKETEQVDEDEEEE